MSRAYHTEEIQTFLQIMHESYECIFKENEMQCANKQQEDQLNLSKTF